MGIEFEEQREEQFVRVGMKVPEEIKEPGVPQVPKVPKVSEGPEKAKKSEEGGDVKDGKREEVSMGRILAQMFLFWKRERMEDFRLKID